MLADIGEKCIVLLKHRLRSAEDLRISILDGGS